MVLKNQVKHERQIKIFNRYKIVKTDIIFYRLFQEFPDIFFELIGKPPESASLYQF